MPAKSSVFPVIELTWGGKSTPKRKKFGIPAIDGIKAPKFLASTTTSVCKVTGKAVKTTTFIWPIRILLAILDLLAAPFGHMMGKDMNFPILWKVGCGMILLSFWLYVAVDRNVHSLLADFNLATENIRILSNLAKVIFPGLVGVAGLCMIVGGVRLQQGKSFSQKYGNELQPLPAFESGVIFKLGDVKLSLRDTHTGIGAFGGIGSGKTVSMMVPLMRQFFRQLNHPDDNNEFARCGALILDEKGDFIDSTITEMLLAGRSLQDLVLIDPDLDLYRYNPLDPNQTADENAEKLGKVQKILGGGSGGDNKYWDDTSKATIKYFLQLLEVYKPKNKIGLDDIARFMRDDELAAALCDEVERIIEEKKKNNEISEDAYGAYSDAVSSTRNAWIELNPNTKSTLKTTIANMLGPIAQNPRLQKVFCRDTNFSFRDLPNKGKVVLFRGSGIDKATARLICVCLKIDFQTWQKRRNGSAAAAFGLNTMRTVLFICDEYQEFVTCGGEGDETFYGVSRSTRTAPIVATQSYNSLETAIKNKEQTKTLRQNIATWVFFRSTDQDTCELGKFLAGQSKKEDYSTSQDTTGLMETASNLAGSGSGKGSSINISKKLEENFRTDDFSRLVTMTMEKSRTGPWYSEAIVYHYHDIDEAAESRCYKTRLPHLYYDNKLRKQAADNVKHLDWVLIDRNWQRKAIQRGMLMVQRSTMESDERKRLDLLRASGRATVEAQKKAAETDPAMKRRNETVKALIENHQQNQQDARGGLSKKEGIPGAINPELGQNQSKEETEANLTRLENELEMADTPAAKERIQVRISKEKQLLSQLILQAATESTKNESRKQILRTTGLPGEENEEEEPTPEEGDPGLSILRDPDDSYPDPQAEPEEESDGEEDEEDDLWEMDIPNGVEVDDSELPDFSNSLDGPVDDDYETTPAASEDEDEAAVENEAEASDEENPDGTEYESDEASDSEEDTSHTPDTGADGAGDDAEEEDSTADETVAFHTDEDLPDNHPTSYESDPVFPEDEFPDNPPESEPDIPDVPEVDVPDVVIPDDNPWLVADDDESQDEEKK